MDSCTPTPFVLNQTFHCTLIVHLLDVLPFYTKDTSSAQGSKNIHWIAHLCVWSKHNVMSEVDQLTPYL
jgi:hypothetical protein